MQEVTYFFCHEIAYRRFISDNIAVPKYGEAAMENWGLIVYGESVLLWDPKESTEDEKEKIATLVSHEIAHQVNISRPF
jgi:aminopeptidase N